MGSGCRIKPGMTVKALFSTPLDLKNHTDFIAFSRHVRPDIIIGRHHRLMAQKFEAIARGEIKRLMIFMPPGHTKSLFGSILLPAWFIGRWPSKRVMHVSHTAELVHDFGIELSGAGRAQGVAELGL